MNQVKKQPMRQCTGCREMKNKKDMIRVVKTADDQILLDLTGKQNGRGAYVCKNEECLQKAMKTKGLERSLKTKIPEDVFAELVEEMKKIEE